MTNIEVGDKVYWNDPDQGLSSGVYEVAEIQTESGLIEYPDDIILITNGNSEAQVYLHELTSA
jgi:hypothetical protein